MGGAGLARGGWWVGLVSPEVGDGRGLSLWFVSKVTEKLGSLMWYDRSLNSWILVGSFVLAVYVILLLSVTHPSFAGVDKTTAPARRS